MNTQLQFPEDNDLQPYKATVEFYPFEPKGMEDVVNQIKAVASLERARANLNAATAARPGESAADEQALFNRENENFNTATTRVRESAGTSLQKRSKGQRRVVDADLNGSIKLYMPGGIQISDGVNIQNVDFGVAGQAGIEALQAGASGKEVIQNTIEDFASNFSSMFSTSLGDGDLAAAGLLRAMRNTPGLGRAADVVSQASRVSINPNTQARFAGVNLREFSFTFTLMPSSARETETIKQIIKTFRQELYPELVTADTGTGVDSIAIGYKFPKQWKIKMKYNNQKVATGILPCYLRNFSATYNSQSMGYHKDGGFTDVQITLSFVETETLSRADIISGNF